MLGRLLLRIALIVAVLTAAFSPAEDKTWIEVRSPHFRVITNGSDGGARRLAREFEQMRAVFASQFPGFRLETGAPLLIVAPRDEGTAKQIAPEVWDRRGAKAAGFYSNGWERQYAFVRLDSLASDPMISDAYSTIYHEYVHSLLHMNFHWLPRWLDEGLASFYEYTRFEKSRTFIGAPPRVRFWMDILERGPLIPMETVLTIGPGSPYYMGDQTKTYLFYAQSWAATHFLTFGPGMQQGEKLRQFFNLLQQGVEQKKAFVQVFGDFPGVDKGLLKYVGQWAFTAAEVPAQGEIEDKEFAIRKMTAAEFEAELAAFHILSHRWKEMKELTEAALKDDPRLGLAHEDMGYFQFNEGKNEEALREFSQAVDLDNTLYRSLFAKTMLSPEANSDGPTDQKKFHDELLNVLSLVPQYAPAFVELAKLNLRQGNYAQALALSRKAEQLEPWRAGYHLLSGQILLRMGRNNEAATYAAFVANRWASVDHDEAMELWNRVPPDQRPKEALQESETEKKEKEWQTADGTVVSVACADNSFTVVLNQGGHPSSYHTKSTPFGFSDTHWWGADHFTPCFHVAGLRAVVHFKPSSDAAYTGELMNVGFRDDLPQTKIAAQPAASAKN